MYLEVNYSCVLRWAGAGGGAAWLAGICSVVRSRSSSEDVTGASLLTSATSATSAC